jgi:hypothetical protein
MVIDYTTTSRLICSVHYMQISWIPAKEVVRSHKSYIGIQYNDQRKDKVTNNDLERTTQKTKDVVPKRYNQRLRPKKKDCWFPLTLPGQFYPAWSINFIDIFSRNKYFWSQTLFFSLLSMDTRIKLSYLPSKKE